MWPGSTDPRQVIRRDVPTVLGYPAPLENVKVLNGQSQLELEAPAAAQNSGTWLQAAVRDGASNGAGDDSVIGINFPGLDSSASKYNTPFSLHFKCLAAKFCS